MALRWMGCVLACLLLAGTALAGFEMQTMTSPQLGETRDILMYTPPGYNANRPNGYPVIVMLHGAGMTPDDFYEDDLEDALDFAMQVGVIQKMILAIPDGSTPEYWEGSFWVDSELYGPFEKYIIHDVVDYVDGNYNTDAVPHERGIAGFSMGGFGALHLANKFPSMWAFTGAIAGPVDMDAMLDMVPFLLLENGGQPPYDYDPDAGFLTSVTFSMAGAFTPDLDDDPPVDFILDENGEVVDDVEAEWDTYFMTSQVGPGHMGGLPLYLAVGTEDELNIYPGYQTYIDLLDQQDIDYTYVEYPGVGHVLTNDMLIDAMVWADDQFDSNPPPLAHLVVLPVDDDLPAGGGVLPYTVDLISMLPQPVPSLIGWVDVVLPNGSVVGPVLQQGFALPGNAHVSLSPTLQVPAGSPTGTYQLRAHVGFTMMHPLIEDEFNFVKAAP